MSKKFTLLLLLLALLAAGITACGRSEPKATPIPFTPTFTPTPAAPIVIHIVSDRPSMPGQMPTSGQALPPSGFNQPNGIVVAPTPAVLDSASDMLSDLSTSQITDDSPAANTVRASAVTTPFATAVSAADAEMSVSAQAETAIQSDTGTAQAGPGGQAPDLASAAAELGVTEEALQATMGEADQGPPDFASIAAELGITEEALMAAMGDPQGGERPTGGPPPNAP